MMLNMLDNMQPTATLQYTASNQALEQLHMTATTGTTAATPIPKPARQHKSARQMSDSNGQAPSCHREQRVWGPRRSASFAWHHIWVLWVHVDTAAKRQWHCPSQ